MFISIRYCISSLSASLIFMFPSMAMSRVSPSVPMAKFMVMSASIDVAGSALSKAALSMAL